MKTSVKLAVTWLGLIAVLGILAPVLANNLPIVCAVEGQWYWPVFSGESYIALEDETLNLEKKREVKSIANFSLYPPIEFAPQRATLESKSFNPPGDSRHFLGTRLGGEDLASGIIHGAATSLKIGFISMFIALFIGLSIGLLSGFYVNRFSIDLLKAIPLVLVFLPGLSFIHVNSDLFPVFPSLLSLSVALFGLWFLLKKYQKRKAVVNFPLDGALSRSTEIVAAFPMLILVLSLSAVYPSSSFTLILLLGLFGWTSIARYTRAEALKMANNDFILSAKISGLSTSRIVVKHLLPNCIGPALVSFTFGVGSAILLESALSFLGFGLGFQEISWGKILAEGRLNIDAWWLVVFPGLSIFFTILSVNTLAQYLKSNLQSDLY